MKTTTLLEVMAEVGRTAGEIGSLRDAPNVGAEARAVLARCNISTAIENTDPGVRRDRLLRSAAWAILALHAHDAEAAQSSGDRAGHGPDCKVDRVMSHCTFDCPKRRSRAVAD